MKKILAIAAILLPVMLIACSHSTAPKDGPKWIQNLVVAFEKESPGNPPQSIWQYEYKAQTVYYVPPQCCDQFSKLYDENGTVICAPDGGFTGQGDGKCPDFFQLRTNGKLFWEDQRSQ